MKSELKKVESQLIALQEKLAEAALVEAQYQSLSISFEELQKQYDARNDEIQKITTEYDELNAKYEQLKRQYDMIVQGNIVFNEEEIDQAIFALINQERKNNGVDELEWGINLYERCMRNSREMAESGKFQYDEGTFISQENFWATKYGTIDQIADATLITWKNNDSRYRSNIINKVHIYGAVGTYKLGDIYYITYMVSILR
ncbi:CAP domain-containing protein [Chloroflexota bacterium]